MKQHDELKQTIYDEAVDYFGFNISTKRRHQPTVIARNCVINYMLKTNLFTLVEVGKMLNRDHSTIINSQKNHNWAFLYNDKKYTDIWYPFERHMNIYLIKQKLIKKDRMYVIEIKNDTAAARAMELFDTGALSEFVELQLMSL